MKLIAIHHNGNSYGRIWTSVPPNGHYIGEGIILIERLAAAAGYVAADILGEDQPYAARIAQPCAVDTAYGGVWGERVILRQVAWALVWQRKPGAGCGLNNLPFVSTLCFILNKSMCR